MHLAASSASGNGADHYALFYQTAKDPRADLSEVFILGANESDYLMRPLTMNAYAMQTEWSSNGDDPRWRTNDQAGVISWTKLGLAYSDGAWTLTSLQNKRPLGVYNNSTESPADGKEVGANSSETGQKFQIYAIERSKFVPSSFSSATSDSPVETYFVINGTFDAPNSQGEPPTPWSYTTNAQNHKANTNSSTYDGLTGRFFENWNGSAFSGKLYQSNYVPNGKYKLSIGIMVNNVGTAGSQYAYANDNKTNVTANGTYTVETTVTNNTIEIGLGLTTDNTANWVAVDNAVLYYIGAVTDFSSYVTVLATEVKNGQAVDTSKPMNATVKQALSDAITEYSAKTEASAYSTAEAWEAAIAAMKKATADATTSIANYETALSYLNAASSFDEAGKASYAADETVKAVQTAYDANTLEAVTDAQVTALNTALATAAKAQTTTGADLTATITNHSFETGNLTGWEFSSADDTGVKENTTGTYSTKNGDGKYLFNTWGGSADKYIYQTIDNLPEGFYTVSVLLASTDGVKVNLVVGDTKTEMTATADFGDHTSGKVYVAVNGSLKIGTSSTDWYKVDNFRLTRYTETKASDDDITALNTAITSAEAKLGFKEGEYAPYNNTGAMTALAAAKAIDQTATNVAADVQAATKALNDATWIANTTDVDIVYNGNFATVEENANYPKGWIRTNSWGEMRTDADKNSTSNGTAYYNQPGSLVYGSRTGYTMPLKANTVYKLTFKYASQEDNSNTSMSASVLNSDKKGLASTSFGANGTKLTAENAFKTATAFFSTDAAGDYVLTLTNGGNTVMTDVSIVEVEAASVTISDAKFATYVTESPVDFSKSTDVTAYTAAYANNVITLTPITAAVPENTPVVLHSETAGTYSLTPAATGTAPEGNALKYYDADTQATGSEWCLTKQGNSAGFAPVATTVPIPARKAYLEIAAGSTEAKFLPIDGTATGINAIGAASDSNNAPRYNLAGQRVGKNYKGVVIVNGKKVIVK